MDYLISFDFDGTLYPFLPCDSECWTLSMICGLDMEKGPCNEDQAEVWDFIKEAMAGHLSRDQFASMVKKRTIGSKLDAFQRACDRLLELTLEHDPSFVKSVSKLKRENTILAVNSCGSDILIEMFLKKAGLHYLFTYIDARNFILEDGIVKAIEPLWLDMSVKAENLKKRKAQAGLPFTISVGDGFTDACFLKASDKGLLVDWGSSNQGLDYPRYENISKACDAIETIINQLQSPMDTLANRSAHSMQ